MDLASTLPEISPNYKPLPYINPTHRKEEDKVLTDVIYVKNQRCSAFHNSQKLSVIVGIFITANTLIFNCRTKVYSGNKSAFTTVPTLFELCIRVLIENIDGKRFRVIILHFSLCLKYNLYILLKHKRTIQILFFFYNFKSQSDTLLNISYRIEYLKQVS